MLIEHRNRRLINTDPQHRCYNGCHYSSELVWTSWELLECSVPEDKIESRLKFWRELNAYAVKERGKEAKSDFRAVQDMPQVREIEL
jgi:hypothetical protein